MGPDVESYAECSKPSIVEAAQHASPEYLRQLAQIQQIDEWFSDKTMTSEQKQRFDRLRASAKDYAHSVVLTTKPSADQTVLLRKIRESLMLAYTVIVDNEVT
jgi:hypothetical protein